MPKLFGKISVSLLWTLLFVVKEEALCSLLSGGGRLKTGSDDGAMTVVRLEETDSGGPAVVAYGQHDNYAFLPSALSPRVGAVLPLRLQYALRLPLEALEQLSLLHGGRNGLGGIRGKTDGGDNYGQGRPPPPIPPFFLLPIREDEDDDEWSLSSPVRPIEAPSTLAEVPVSHLDGGGPFFFFLHRPDHPVVEIPRRRRIAGRTRQEQLRPTFFYDPASRGFFYRFDNRLDKALPPRYMTRQQDLFIK